MPKVITGHQPVYLPWLGLFHKISLADIFIFMDDVQYLSQDWNNRNRIKTPHGWMWLTVPVSIRRSKSALLKDILIDNSRSGAKDDWQTGHWKSIHSNYKRAPYFGKYSDFFHDMYMGRRWERLADINEYQLRFFLKAMKIKTEFYKASELDFTKKKSELVLEHCLRFNADICVTGCNGRNYIDEDVFRSNGIRVCYQNYNHPEYDQLWGKFIPNISAIDLLFNKGNAMLDIICEGNITREGIEDAVKDGVAGVR